MCTRAAGGRAVGAPSGTARVCSAAALDNGDDATNRRYIPSELGYGERGSPPKIPGGSVLVSCNFCILFRDPSTFEIRMFPATEEKTPSHQMRPNNARCS